MAMLFYMCNPRKYEKPADVNGYLHDPPNKDMARIAKPGFFMHSPAGPSIVGSKCKVQKEDRLKLKKSRSPFHSDLTS